MGSRVLVTGATGFIGSRLVPSFREAGHDVRISHARLDHDLPAEDDVDVVVHLAARTFVPASWDDPIGFYQTNTLGTLRVLDRYAREGRHIVYLSSYVYGTPDVLPIGEEAERRPVNPYMHSKVLAEDCCTFFASHRDVTITVIRPFNVYGEGQASPFLIPSLIEQLLDPGRASVLVQDDRPRRDYLYVNDLVEMVLMVVRDRVAGTFNAGSGVSHSVRDVHELLCVAARTTKPLVVRGEQRPGEVPDVVADVRRADHLLGWRPRTTFAAGLARVVGAWQAS